MSEQETETTDQEPKNQGVEIDDLPVSQSEQDEVKGGMGRPSISAVLIPPVPRGS